MKTTPVRLSCRAGATGGRSEDGGLCRGLVYTKVKILIGGFDAQAILDSAGEGITESLNKAGDAEPIVALLSDCCARGGRLREFRKSEECEVKQAILPAMEAKGGKFPILSNAKATRGRERNKRRIGPCRSANAATA